MCRTGFLVRKKDPTSVPSVWSRIGLRLRGQRLGFIVLPALLAGCIPAVRRDLKPIALPGSEIRIVQSKYEGIDAIPEFYTNAEEIRIDIVIGSARSNVRQTVLWFRQDSSEPWRRGPSSPPGERWIVFRPPEGRFQCRASAIYATGVEAFIPRDNSPPCFYLVADRTPPTLTLYPLDTVLANTTTNVRFEVWDSGLAPTATAEIYFSSDAGTSWERLAVFSVELGENSYSWRVPDRPGPDNLLRLVCRDLAGNESHVQTEKMFKILPHPTTRQAIERFIHGVPQESPSADEEKESAAGTQKPEEKTAKPQGESSSSEVRPSSFQRIAGAAAMVGTRAAGGEEISLGLEVPSAVKAGSTVDVVVTGLSPGVESEKPRLLWRSSPADEWRPADAVRTGAIFKWRCPRTETYQGRLKVELPHTAGGIRSTGCESADIAVDGTPPEITLVAVPSSDAETYAVRASARDAGSGTEWIKLYVTRDGGVSWELYSERKGPRAEAQVRREAHALGFFAQARDKVGNATPEPAAGAAPVCSVPARADLTVLLHDLDQPVLRGGERILLTWEVRGAVPAGASALLARKDEADGLWTRIETLNLKRERFLWEVPDSTLSNLWLRVEIETSAGVVAVSNSIGPFAVDNAAPELKLASNEFRVSSRIRIPVLQFSPGPAPLAGARIYLRRKGASSWRAIEAVYDNGRLSASTSDLAEGSYEFRLQARDTVGNETPPPTPGAEPQGVIVVDKTPPAVSLTLREKYYEGVPGAVDVSVDEPADIVLFFQPSPVESETALLSLHLAAGTSPVSFTAPPGSTAAFLWVRGTDAAGNRYLTDRRAVKIERTLKLLSPDNGEVLTAGRTVSVEYWVHPALLGEKPELSLWWIPAPESARKLLSQALDGGGSYEWRVPDRAGPGQRLVLEAKIKGILRAQAYTPGSFEIKKGSTPNATAGSRIVEIDPLSAEEADKGDGFLERLESALRENRTEETDQLRLQAETHYRAALSIDQRNWKAYFGLARLSTRPLGVKDDLPSAEKYLLEAVRVNPGYYEALVYLGIARIKLRKYREAESALGRALNIQDDPLVRYDLGLALLRQGKYVPALEEFAHASRAVPPVKEAYECMVECWSSLGNYAKAQQVLNEATEKGMISSAAAEKWRRYLKRKIAARG